MIVKEFYKKKAGTKEIYSETVNVEGAPYEYEETKEVIEDEVLE